MTGDALSVTVSLTEGDRYQAQRIYFKKRKKAKKRRIVAIAALLAVPAAFLYLRSGDSPFTRAILRNATAFKLSSALLALVFITGIWVIVSLSLRRRASIRRFRRGLAHRASLCTYTFSEGGIDILLPGESDHLDFSGVQELIEDFYGLLIVPYIGDVIYLPTRVLYGSELSRVRALLEEQVAHAQ